MTQETIVVGTTSKAAQGAAVNLCPKRGKDAVLTPVPLQRLASSRRPGTGCG